MKFRKYVDIDTEKLSYLEFGDHVFAIECGQRVPRIFENSALKFDYGIDMQTGKRVKTSEYTGDIWLPVTERMLWWYNNHMYARLVRLRYFEFSDFAWSLWERLTPFLDKRREAKWARIDSELTP